MDRSSLPGRLIRIAIAAGLSVALSTVVVALLEQELGVPNASSLYVVAVAIVAISLGIAGAALTAVISVVVYDYVFTIPVHTLSVADPGEWLNLVLLLFVAVIVGQLAAAQRRRAETAIARDAESRALFQVARSLATRASLASSLPDVVSALTDAARADRVWIALGEDDAAERVVAQSGTHVLDRAGRGYHVLHADPGVAARWTLVRPPSLARSQRSLSATLLRVRILDSGDPAGSIWLERRQDRGTPGPQETALLVVTSDLLGQALAHDRLAEETRRSEIARQTDSVKTALLESVSHNLRTPLASIRASAGTLMDPDVHLSGADTRASAESIDRAAQRLNRLVGNLLDLSRIEGGALRAAQDVVDLDEIVMRVVREIEPRIGPRRLDLRTAQETPVLGDPVLLEEAVLNVLDNAILHTQEDAIVRVSAEPSPEPDRIVLTIEDSGPGVPDDALDRIFEKFYRSGTRPGATSGTGIGLAIVKGFVEATGGSVRARRSELGGLAIDIDLRAAPPDAT